MTTESCSRVVLAQAPSQAGPVTQQRSNGKEADTKDEGGQGSQQSRQAQKPGLKTMVVLENSSATQHQSEEWWWAPPRDRVILVESSDPDLTIFPKESKSLI